MYSQTIWFDGVTSKSCPAMPSVIRVFPLGNRSAPPVKWVKKETSGSPRYCQTISLVAGSTSTTREELSPRRCAPLSRSSTLPLARRVGLCWWEICPGPHCHLNFPVARSAMATVSKIRKLIRKVPSGVEMSLAPPQAARPSRGQITCC